MMHLISLLVDLVLAGYIGYEVVQFVPRYRKLKQEVANGDPQARGRVYRRALVFEWISALLALIALGFDWSKLNPKSLALEGASIVQKFSPPGGLDRSAMLGVLCGLAIGTVIIIVARFRANRRGVESARPTSPFRKLLPDFNALLPVTTRERLVWAVVAISAGICEEVVFRGWLLSTLHTALGLDGTVLIAVAAVAFGLAHSYQKITGMLLTGFLGAFFCVLYVKTGSLLVPILLHIFVDLCFAILPAPRRVAETQASFA